MTRRSSMEHCRRCLTELRMKVRAPRMSTQDMAAQLELYAEDLTAFEPETVRRACREWYEENPSWPAAAELLRLCREVAQRSRPSLEAPKARDHLDEAILMLPNAVGPSIDYPTSMNGGVPWAERVPRREIMRAIAKAWTVTPPRPALVEDPFKRSRARFAFRLGEALRIALESGDPSRIEPGGDLAQEWVADEGSPWWSHDGLRDLVEGVEEKRWTPQVRALAIAIIVRHLEAGRMPEDVGDRAMAIAQASEMV